jgi:phosphoribosylformylglycinamidine cyclo-ligase
MNVNDMICIGAEPLAMVDYLALEDPDPHLMGEIGKGLNEGCRQSDCSIIGGETSSIPDIVSGFDLAATCMGYVKKDEMIEGRNIKDGDVIVGVPSSGLHSNGYSLVRKVIDKSRFHNFSDFDTVCRECGVKNWPEFKGMTLGEVCLIPTRIYVKQILGLIKKAEVHGLAHITGGGLKNIPRLNHAMDFIVDDPMPVHPIFQVIQAVGGVPDRDMWQTFNMGMGFAVICPAKEAQKVVSHMNKTDPGTKAVGRIKKGKGLARQVPLGLEYTSL